MAIELGAKLNLDTQEASQSFQSFINSTNNMLTPVNGPNQGPFAGNIFNNPQQQLNLQTSLNDSLVSLTEGVNKVLEKFKSLSKTMDETNRNALVTQNMQQSSGIYKNNPNSVLSNLFGMSGNSPMFNPDMAGDSAIKGKWASALGYGSAVFSGINAFERSKLQADYIGAQANALNAGGGILTSLGGVAALIPGLQLAGLGMMGAGTIAKSVAEYKQTKNQKFGMLSDLSDSFDSIGSAYNLYNINGTWNDNYLRGLNAYSGLRDKNKGSGLKDEEYLRYVANMSRYGVTDISSAGDIVTQANAMARNTNGDINSIMAFMGTMERYGGAGTGTTALQMAKAASDASGLTGTQFNEFLTGLTQAVESGISKGFIKSADDVAESLTMLSLASGNNPLWQGEQGAQRYNQLVSGMAQNTSLSNVSNMLLYRAADKTLQGKNLENVLGKGGYIDGASYANTMAYIEKGDLSADFIKNLYGNISSAYGGDKDAIVETLKQQFGLNYEGAIQVSNLFEQIATNPESYSKEAIQAQIKEQQDKNGDPTKTYQTVMTTHTDNINREVANISGQLNVITEGLKETGIIRSSNNGDGKGGNGVVVARNSEYSWDDIKKEFNDVDNYTETEKKLFSNGVYMEESKLKDIFDYFDTNGSDKDKDTALNLFRSLITQNSAPGDIKFTGENNRYDFDSPTGLEILLALETLVEEVKHMTVTVPEL